MLPAPRPCGGAAAPAEWLSPSGITKSAPVPRFRRPKHSSFCRVIVAARARSTSLQLPILDCRLYFTGQHRKNQYFFAGPHNFFAAACALYLSPAGRAPRPRARFFRCPPSRTRRGRRPRRPASCSFAKGIFRAPARHPFAPPAAPFLPAAEEVGKRTPPKTNGFWNSFRPIAVAVQKGSATNRLCAYPRCR